MKCLVRLPLEVVSDRRVDGAQARPHCVLDGEGQSRGVAVVIRILAEDDHSNFVQRRAAVRPKDVVRVWVEGLSLPKEAIEPANRIARTATSELGVELMPTAVELPMLR